MSSSRFLFPLIFLVCFSARAQVLRASHLCLSSLFSLAFRQEEKTKGFKFGRNKSRTRLFSHFPPPCFILLRFCISRRDPPGAVRPAMDSDYFRSHVSRPVPTRPDPADKTDTTLQIVRVPLMRDTSCCHLWHTRELTGCVWASTQTMSWGTLGTVRPFSNFRADRDAAEIQSALERKGRRVSAARFRRTSRRPSSRCAPHPDAVNLVRVLTNRSNAQRQLIADAFREMAQKVREEATRVEPGKLPANSRQLFAGQTPGSCSPPRLCLLAEQLFMARICLYLSIYLFF